MSLALATFALDYLGWMLLCLGLPRHYREHFGALPPPHRARWLRAGGWLLCAAALAVAVAMAGWGIGAVTWAAAWMLAAVAWVLLQPLRPPFARALAPALLALAVLGLLAG